MTPHSWRTLSQSPADLLLSCTRCGAQTNNALLADIHNNCPVGEPTPTESLIGFDGDGVPETHVESFATLAQKLEQANYVPPTLASAEHDETVRRFDVSRDAYLTSKPTWRTFALWIAAAVVGGVVVGSALAWLFFAVGRAAG